MKRPICGISVATTALLCAPYGEPQTHAKPLMRLYYMLFATSPTFGGMRRSI